MWDNVPALIRKALRDGKDIAEAITWTDECGKTLLHVFVSAWARNSFDPWGDFDMWRELVRDCISAGASIEAVDLAKRTPLQALIDEFWPPGQFGLGDGQSDWSLERVSGQLEDILYCWLADLAAAGVDLEKYGATESSIRQPGTEFTQCDCEFHRVMNWYSEEYCTFAFGFRLVGFSYGSLVTDWQFWFSNPTDIFAGDFWTMIETIQDDDLGPKPTLDIPGSWSEGK